METFSALLALCAGNSPVTGEFPAQKPVTRSLGVSFDLCQNNRLNKQSWGLWFETPLRSLWRHRNELRLSDTFVSLHNGFVIVGTVCANLVPHDYSLSILPGAPFTDVALE